MRTADGSLSAQFEHTLLVTRDGCEVLTARETRAAQQRERRGAVRRLSSHRYARRPPSISGRGRAARGVADLDAADHARDLLDALGSRELAHAACCVRPRASRLVDDEVRVGERGDLRQVGDADHLPVPRDVGDRRAR